MNEFVYKLTLDLNCAKTPPVICSGQFDKGRKFEFTITANGEPYDVTGCSAVLKGVRTDGSHFAFECNVSDGKIIKTLDDTTLSVRGKTVAKLVISDSEKSYSTQMFIIDVDSALDGDITVADDYSILNRLIEQIHALNESGAILIDDTIDKNSNNAVANKAVAISLASKEIIDNKVTDKIKITDEDANYPSIGYLHGYYYDFSEVDGALSGKLDNTAGSVTTDHIASKAVTTDKIANGAITALKIANRAVSGSNIAQDQINTNHLQSGAVTADKLADEVKTSINDKADKAETISGYGITDAYTKDETNSLNYLKSWQDVLTNESKKGNYYFEGKSDSTDYGKKKMSSSYYGALFNVNEGDKFKITCRTTSNTLLIIFYSDYTYVDGTAIGESFIVVGSYGTHSKNYNDNLIIVPEGAKYMGVCTYLSGSYGIQLKVQKWDTDKDMMANTRLSDLILNLNAYNVMSFGAYGDGEHDDTTAFQKCLEAANGKPIVVPQGTYVVNNTADNAVNYTGDIILIGCGNPKLVRTATSDLKAKSQVYQPMITINNCNRADVIGINFDGQRDNFVDADTNEWIGTAALYFLGNNANITVEHCIFENCSREAIYCGGNTENVYVANNVFNKVSANFWAHDGNIKNVIFENNYSNKGRTKAVEFDVENGYSGENIVVRGNKFTNLVQVAVMLSNCHNVIVEGNEYDYWTGSMSDYSAHMGSSISSEPYFVFASTDPDSTTVASDNYCSDITVRNNIATCHRLVNLQVATGSSGVESGDVLFKNIEVYSNTAKCSNCLVRANSSDGITSHDNRISGNLTMGAHSVGADVSNIVNYYNVIEGKALNIPSATVTDNVLSVNGFAFTDIIRLALSADTTITDIAMTGYIGAKVIMFVTGAALMVTASDTILNSKTIEKNSVAEFIYNGSKWLATGADG